MKWLLCYAILISLEEYHEVGFLQMWAANECTSQPWRRDGGREGGWWIGEIEGVIHTYACAHWLFCAVTGQ